MTQPAALVTGASGFLGRHVARGFSLRGWNVVGTGVRSPENSPRESLSSYEQLTLPSPRIYDLVARVKPEVCVHCAGPASVGISIEDPAGDFRGQVEVTFNLLDAIRTRAPECRVIFLSSAAIYGNPQRLPVLETQAADPISPYGFHKQLCERLCMEFVKVYGLRAAVGRIFSAYGPGLRRQVLWDTCVKALTQPVLKMRGTGNESRDFVHASDVVSSIHLLAKSAPCRGEAYNIGTGAETTIRELAELILGSLRRKIQIEFDQLVPTGDPLNWRADLTQLSALGFRPEIDIRKGVADYVEWCQREVI